MRLSLIISFLSFSLLASAQSEGMFRAAAGVTGKIIKPIGWSADINSRFNDSGLETFFPQLGISYKVSNWFKPSFDYRFLIDKNKYGNYKLLNRINLNLKFKHSIDRLGLGFRIRYQFAFKGLSSISDYDPDLDQAFRFKPSFSYNLKSSIFTPQVSTEFFINPDFIPYEQRFAKYRFAVGTGINLKGPNEINLKYFIEERRNKNLLRHVIQVSFTHKL